MEAYKTPWERAMLYEALIAKMESIPLMDTWGICYHIRDMIGEWNRMKEEGWMESMFPEIGAQKPDRFWDSTNYWFPLNKEGKEKRISVLRTAIQSCHQIN